MDFGFVRGSAFSGVDEMGRTITSIDGFCSYLVIVDRATRYKWVFLTTTKHPPLKEAERILQKFHSKLQQLHCTVRTNQGGELGKSHKFQKLVDQYRYTFTPTGTDNSRQNGLAKKPNQDLKRITKCLLHSAGLTSGYWSYAMNHAVFLANRIFHTGIHMTPYQAMHHVQPELGKLRIFGAKCYYKHTKNNQKNMDIPSKPGIFLGYKATMKNVYVRDDTTKKVHNVTHKTFDEAHMTVPTAEQPPMSQALLQAGYNNAHTTNKDEVIAGNNISVKIQLLSEHAKEPTRGTPGYTGLDLYSPTDIVVEPGEQVKIATDIIIAPAHGTYAQIAPRSSYAAKGISILGGVIDQDYRGNIYIITTNQSKSPFYIKYGQKLAQMIFKKIWTPKVEIVKTLDVTE